MRNPDVSPMRATVCALLVLASLTFYRISYAQSDEQYAITSTPAWVIPVAAVVPSPDMDSVDGQRYLLLDRQHYNDGNIVAFHRHFVTEVVGQAGLSDNSKLSVSFDPSYQRLELHAASVIRNGSASDRLQNARISVARTENESDNDLLHGEVTALVVLTDVRIGDIVEVRYTLFGRNPVFDSRHHSWWRMQWGVPVERNSLHITVPQSMALQHTPRPDATFSEELNGGLRTSHWIRNAIAPSEVDEGIPGWYADPDTMQVTAFPDWQSVANWGASLFAGHQSSGEEYLKLSREIQRVEKNEGIDAAIAEAIDFVQKSIRYYGIELGENSHRPHSPDVVLRNGYGDCKDKALLLISLLDDLGVDAWPLLVSTYSKQGVADMLPSPGVFNHVVVLIDRGETQHWVDATDNTQAGTLGLRGQPEYGAGLVLGKSGQTMIFETEKEPATPDTVIHDEFHMSSFGGPVDFVSTRVYRGDSANRFRASLDRAGKRGYQRWVDEGYESNYGKLQALEPMKVVEDRRSNEISVRLEYRLSEFWDVDKRAETVEFFAYATAVTGLLEDFDDIPKSRNSPLRVYGNGWVVHRLQFYPNMASPARSLEETSISIPGFAYQDSEYVLGNSLVFDSEIKVDTKEIAMQDLPDYEKFQNRVERNALQSRFIQQYDKDRISISETKGRLLEGIGALYP